MGDRRLCGLERFFILLAFAAADAPALAHMRLHVLEQLAGLQGWELFQLKFNHFLTACHIRVDAVLDDGENATALVIVHLRDVVLDELALGIIQWLIIRFRLGLRLLGNFRGLIRRGGFFNFAFETLQFHVQLLHLLLLLDHFFEPVTDLFLLFIDSLFKLLYFLDCVHVHRLVWRLH